MKFIQAICLISLCTLLMWSCSDEVGGNAIHVPVLPDAPLNYQGVTDNVEDFKLPQSLALAGQNIETNVIPNPIHEDIFFPNDIDPSFTNPIVSNEIARLGRVLFYDNRLSKNNSISCASCHKQTLGFADDVALSEGFGGSKTLRNSMTIANPMVNRTFFWDGRSHSLRDLALQPIFDHVEMGIDSPEELISKIRQESYYPELFEAAFGDEIINRERVSDAIGSFVASIFTHDSKFDAGLKDEFAQFSELEKHGMGLFFSTQTNCSSCHNGINFASPTSNFNNPYGETGGTTNIGLDLQYSDPGFEKGKFKIPSLRNITMTGPYMHDGRFDNLRSVLEHYNDNIKPHTDLDSKLSSTAGPVRMGLTELDLDALEAFLGTLTSRSIATDERFSNPFQS